MTTKEVKELEKSLSYKGDFYLSVFRDLKSGLMPPAIASKHGISKQRLNWYIRKIKALGLVKRVGYGVWECAQKTEKEVKEQVKELLCSSPISLKTNSPKSINRLKRKAIRGHGFIFTLKIPKFNNWGNRENFLKRNNIDYIRSKIANGEAQRIIINKFKVWLYNKTIVLFTPKGRSFLSESAKASRLLALENCFEVIYRLESMFKVSLRISKRYYARVSKHHYADIKNELAKDYNKKGKKLYLANEKGRWLVIDNSWNLKELETTHKETAVKDMDEVVMPFFNSLKAQPFTAFDFRNLAESTKNLADTTQSMSAEYMANIKLHLETLRKMGATLSKIDKGIKRMGKK